MTSELWSLAEALADVGREVRDAVGVPELGLDAEVLRIEGGDEIFRVDDRADQVLLAALETRCGQRWPGEIVIEGFDDRLTIGGGGPWRYLVDPVDGSRPWMWGKRSAFCLLAAGRDASSLSGLEASAVVELPTAQMAYATVASAVRNGGVHAVLDSLGPALVSTPTRFRPATSELLDHRFVSVMRYAIGTKAAVGAFEDAFLDGLSVYEDPYICTGGLLLEVAMGRQAAVIDPRPAIAPRSMAAHPYDLAGMLVATEAGVLVEDLHGNQLNAPLDTSTKVAYAAYANQGVAAILRPRLLAALQAVKASS